MGTCHLGNLSDGDVSSSACQFGARGLNDLFYLDPLSAIHALSL